MVTSLDHVTHFKFLVPVIYLWKGFSQRLQILYSGWPCEVLVFGLQIITQMGVVFKFWEIILMIYRKWCKIERHGYNGKANRKSCMAYWMAWLPMTLSEAEGHCSVLNLYNSDSARNITCFNYSVLTHKLESTRGLWFRLYYQTWRTSQRHRQ